MVNRLDDNTLYSSQELKRLAMKGQTLRSGEFDDCTFSRCGFQETSFEYCTFHDCTFRDCDFGLARVKGCSFDGVTFEGCQLIGINWTETVPAKSLLREPMRFVECALNHSVFLGLDLKGMVLTRCVARDVDFSDCDLTGADCRYTDFAESRFAHTDLTGADFKGATNYAISATLNTLKGTKFSLPEAMALLRSLDIILTEG